MPYKSHWLVPNQLYFTKWYGYVTEDELRTFVDEMTTAMETTSAQYVHNITITEGVSQGLPLQRGLFISAEMVKHPKFGWLVMVDNIPEIARFSIVLFMRVLNVRYHSEKTLEDAITHLQSVDPSLQGIIQPTLMVSE